jgi:chondroitin-sulfate-ABC endolyase/exolyase
MYSYNTLSYVLDALGSGNSMFQINVEEYKLFRDAVFYRTIVANNNDVVSITLSGRSGKRLITTYSKYAFRSLAIAGGKILGLLNADPLLAGIYRRKYGSYPFSITPSPFEEGFFQFNYAMGGVFRKNNYVITTRGQTNNIWGSEIYPTENRYGRYQSYGILDIVYPGDINETNGYNSNGEGWDWRYNPGTTTKVLEWNKLVASTGRIDEQQTNRFAGTLAFKNKGATLLNKVWGTYGVFGMDFNEKTGGGFQGTFGPDTHDNSFTFRKSNFFFDDMIICLGSGINNNDTTNPTITTLYQRIVPNPSKVKVNNSDFDEIGQQTYSQNSINWVVDYSGTGFYIASGSGDLKIQRLNQQTPSGNGNFNPSTATVLGTSKHVGIGFLDHGLAPSNKEYEYVVIPNTNSQAMVALATTFQNPVTKAYTVLQKDNDAHIVKHLATGIYAYCLFKPISAIDTEGYLFSNDNSCLIMYQIDNVNNNQMKLALSNPDVGITDSRSLNKTVAKIINIKLNGNWSLVNPNPAISLIEINSTSTTFAFSTIDGLPIEADFVLNNLGFEISSLPRNYGLPVRCIKD